MNHDFTCIDGSVAGAIAAQDALPSDGGAKTAGGRLPPDRLDTIDKARAERRGNLVTVMDHARGRTAVGELHAMQPGDVRRSFADVGPIIGDAGLAQQAPNMQGVSHVASRYGSCDGF